MNLIKLATTCGSTSLVFCWVFFVVVVCCCFFVVFLGVCCFFVLGERLRITYRRTHVKKKTFSVGTVKRVCLFVYCFVFVFCLFVCCCCCFLKLLFQYAIPIRVQTATHFKYFLELFLFP